MAPLLLLVGVLLAMIVSVAYSILGDELRAWLPYLARWLVRSAASRLPAEDRQRYERDWLAELAAWEDRPLSSLGKALNIRLRVRGIEESVMGVSLRGHRLTRALDVVMAIVMLTAFAPLLITLSIAIRLESRGPVFFRSERIGRNGEPFALLKFRSMRGQRPGHLEELGDLTHPELMSSLQRRTGVTRVGQFIRRTSLDELPQFFNVLRGEMSLVGPRPSPYASANKTDGSESEVRHSVRPGIVDPCLIDDPSLVAGDPYETGDRSAEWDRKEAAYVRSRSFLGDVRILLRTPLVVLRRGFWSRDQF